MIIKKYSGLFEPTFNVQRVLDKVGGASREETKQMLKDYENYLEACKAWDSRPITPVPAGMQPSFFSESVVSFKSRPQVEDEEEYIDNEDKYTRNGQPQSVDVIVKSKGSYDKRRRTK